MKDYKNEHITYSYELAFNYKTNNGTKYEHIEKWSKTKLGHSQQNNKMNWKEDKKTSIIQSEHWENPR